MTSPSEKHMDAARELMEGRINSMCMTWDHSFGIMDESDADCLRRAFRKISYHDIVPFVAAAISNAEREGMKRAAEIALEGWLPYAGTAQGITVKLVRDSILSEIGDKQ